ncbi:MAG: FMN-binding glutamate synthase family protein, partial [Pseudomonadota bacterium]
SGKPVGIKAVIGDRRWLEEFFTAILNRGAQSSPDFISVDGAEGGTGAAPASLIDFMGLPLRESLPLVVDLLNKFGLRQRVRVVASGKLINPAQIAWALCVGADFAASARGFMFSLGCIQAMQCNKNTCPTGITTHDKKLQRGLVVSNKRKRVANYARSVRAEVAMIAHACGVTEPRQLQRHHCRIVQADGRSMALDELYPEGID